MADQEHIEQWRPVFGYEGVYEVSDAGRVRRVPGPWAANKTGKFISYHVVKSGYRRVNLCMNGRGAVRSVHVLVCEAFHGPRRPGMQCDHIDGNRTNNFVSNLRWVTPRENVVSAIERNGGCPWNRGGRHAKAKLTGFQVRVMRWMCDFGVAVGWQTMLSDIWGVSHQAISYAAHRRTWTNET